MKVTKKMTFAGYEFDCKMCNCGIRACRSEVGVYLSKIAFKCPNCGTVQIIPKRKVNYVREWKLENE